MSRNQNYPLPKIRSGFRNKFRKQTFVEIIDE